MYRNLAYNTSSSAYHHILRKEVVMTLKDGPVLVSKISSLDDIRLFQHVVRCAKNPDSNSEFDLATKDIRDLPGRLLFAELLDRHYDGFIFCENNEIAGHAFWQSYKNNEELKLFSLFVQPNFQHQGRGTKQIEVFLRYAYEHRVRSVDIGAGGNEKVLHIWHKAISGNLNLPFKLEAGQTSGSIKILREPFSVAIA